MTSPSGAIGALTGGGGGGSWNAYEPVGVPGSSSGGLGDTLGAMGEAAGSAAMSMAPGSEFTGGLTGGAKLEPAQLDVFEPPKDPKNPRVDAKLSTLSFAINPHTISFDKSAKWKPGPDSQEAEAGIPQFGGASGMSLKFEVWFDTSDDLTAGKNNVVAPVNKLMACCVATDQSVASKNPSPPWLQLHWGKTTYPFMIMKSIAVQYPLFAGDGTPLRAKCSLALEEVGVTMGKQNPTSGALAAQDTHLLVAGDTLASVAYQHYGNASLWRVIADANGIDDPSRLAVGTTLLLLPSLTEASGRA